MSQDGLNPALPEISLPADSVTLQVAADNPKMVIVKLGSKVRVSTALSLFNGQTGTIEAIDKPLPRKKSNADVPVKTWLLVKMDDQEQFPEYLSGSEPPSIGEKGAVWFSENDVVPV